MGIILKPGGGFPVGELAQVYAPNTFEPVLEDIASEMEERIRVALETGQHSTVMGFQDDFLLEHHIKPDMLRVLFRDLTDRLREKEDVECVVRVSAERVPNVLVAEAWFSAHRAWYDGGKE